MPTARKTFGRPFCRLRNARASSIVALLLILPALALPALASPKDGCAAYARSGLLASITIKGQLKLAITEANGKVVQFNLGTPFPTDGCSAFFSNDSTLLAVALHPARKPQPLTIALFDAANMRWLTPTPSKINLAQDSRGDVIGFSGDSHRLLVLSDGSYFAATGRTTAFVVAVDPIERRATTSVFSIAGESFSSGNHTIDVTGERLWVVEQDERACFLHSYPIASGQRERTQKLLDPECQSADLLVSLNRDSVLQFSHDARSTIIRSFDSDLVNTQSLRLSAPAVPGQCQAQGGYSRSADNTLLAVALKCFDEGRFGSTRVRDGIAIVGVRPLKLIRFLGYPELPSAFAVTASDNHVRIASFTHGVWSTRVIDDAN